MTEKVNKKTDFYLLGKENISLKDVIPHGKKNGYPVTVPRWYTKFFEIFPGAITWFFLLSPILAAIAHKPMWFVYYMSFMAIFWTIRGLWFITGIWRSYRLYLKESKIDWAKRIKDENLDDSHVKYVLVYPLYREDLSTVIRPAIKAWSESKVDTKKKFTILFAVEEKYAEQELKYIEEIKKEFKDKFREMITVVHPVIEGEVRGVKTGNINYATRMFVDMLRKRGENVEDYLLISCDSDQRPDPQYLPAITYKYLTSDDPQYRVFMTAIHLFDNNLWRVPVLVRVLSEFITFSLMFRWGVRTVDGNDTFSAYVANLAMVERMEFWDPQLENDDTMFYLNGRSRFGPRFRSVAVWVPTHNDAVENKTPIETYKSLWKQQVRWGWGTIVVPAFMAQLLHNKSLSIREKLAVMFRVFDDRLWFRTAALLITFGLPLLGLLSPEYRYSAASYNLPRLLKIMMNIIMFFVIPLAYVRTKVIPTPKHWPLWKRAWSVVEIAWLTVVLYTFGFFPATQAQTEMMFRKGPKTEHYVTDKVTIQNA